jgi:hypothetical protein
METPEAIWVIVQLLFWIAVTGAVGYFCFLVLGLILFSLNFCFIKVVQAIKSFVEMVLLSILDAISCLLSFLVMLVGLKQRENQYSGHENSESTEEHSSPQTNASVFDPYQILQVTPRASRKEIKEAYLKQMSQYHPDKVSHLGDELKILAEEKSKHIQQAYSSLQSA